jgi:hypothetical protein
MKKFMRLGATLAITAAVLGAGSVTSNGVLHSFVSTEARAAGYEGTTIENSIIYELYDDGTAMAYAVDGSISGEIIIPETVTRDGTQYTVTTINNRVFASDTITKVSAKSVTTIVEGAFSYCTGLTSVDMPKVTTIGDEAFYSCEALTGVNMPEVTTIGTDAFKYCNKLKTVYVSENCTYAFDDGVTKRAVVNDESVKIVFKEGDDYNFDVIVNKDRFGGYADEALYIDKVEILVDGVDSSTPLRYYTEDTNTITYHVRLKNKPVTDTNIRIQLHAYGWDSSTSTKIDDESYYYCSLAQTIKAASGKINPDNNELDENEINYLSF